MFYQPKKSSARWGFHPPFVLAVYDNGGKTADRYTVLFGFPFWVPNMGRRVPYLSMSAYPTHPQGISMWGEMPSNNRDALGKHIRWTDLPPEIQKHVLSRCHDTPAGVPADPLLEKPAKSWDEALARWHGWFAKPEGPNSFTGVARSPKDNETAESFMAYPLVHATSWKAAIKRDGLKWEDVH